MQVSVARYLRTPPYAAKRKDLVDSGVGELALVNDFARIGRDPRKETESRSTRSFGICLSWTDNGGTSPSKSWPL